MRHKADALLCFAKLRFIGNLGDGQTASAIEIKMMLGFAELGRFALYRKTFGENPSAILRHPVFPDRLLLFGGPHLANRHGSRFGNREMLTWPFS